MPIFNWDVEALVIDDDAQKSRNEYGIDEPHPRVARVVILVDDEEWLRCHYDAEREEWVETASAHMTGHFRSSQRTVSELLSWLLSSRSRVVVDKIVRKVQGHFDTAKDRAAAQAERERADELREKAEG
jgi:hypothetical protein